MAWTWEGSGDACPHVWVPCTHVGCVYCSAAALCLSESLRTEATTLCEPSLEVRTSPGSSDPSAHAAWQSLLLSLRAIHDLSHVQSAAPPTPAPRPTAQQQLSSTPGQAVALREPSPPSFSPKNPAPPTAPPAARRGEARRSSAGFGRRAAVLARGRAGEQAPAPRCVWGVNCN